MSREHDDVTRFYVQSIGPDEWGLVEAVSDEEHEAAVQRMQTYLDENEGPLLCCMVMSSAFGRGAVNGLCVADRNGSPIAGIVEQEVRDLYQRAWEHACESWT